MKKFKTLSIVVIILGLVLFSGSQFYTRQAYKQQLEANYQRAVRELSVHINGIEVELAKLRVANSSAQQMDSSANLLRLIYSAQANLGQLPLNGLNLSYIESLLAKVQTDIVRSTKNYIRGIESSLSIELEQIYPQICYVNEQLQTELNRDEWRTSWVDWKKYFQTSIMRSANVEPGDRYPLMQSLVKIEDGLQRFTDSDFTGELDRFKGQLLEGDLISKKDALVIAQVFLQDLTSGRQVTITDQIDSKIPVYTIEATGEGYLPIVLEISQTGGHVLWMTNGRLVSDNNLSLQQLSEIAIEFLSSRSYPPVEIVYINRLQNRYLFGFAIVEKNVIIYPQQLVVQVAADNGEVLGFNSLAYHSFQRQRELIPTLSVEEAQQYVGNADEIVAKRLALILDDNYTEILTYEFRVNYGEDQFLVYINADLGYEEKLTRVEPQESISR